MISLLSSETSIHFKQYNIYSANVRNWFVYYSLAGIGFIILRGRLTNNQEIFPIIFLGIAAFLQILLALINKYSQFCCDYNLRHKKESNLIFLGIRMSSMVWVDILIDFSSFILLTVSLIYLIKSII